MPNAIAGAPKPPRGRRAPLMILAVMLVFALGGSAWLTVKLFTRSDDTVTGVELSSRKSPLRTVRAERAIEPAPAITPTDSSPTLQLPPAAEAPSLLTPPPAADPVTNDPPAPSRVAEKAEPPALPPISPERGNSAAPSPPPAITPPPLAKAEPPPPPVIAKAETPKPLMARAPPPAKSAKPVRTAARTGGGTYRIQLSSLPTEASAKKAQRRLTRRFGRILGDATLQIRAADLGRKGTVYRIRSAPVFSMTEAKKTCKLLVAKKQGCFVSGRR